MNKKLLFVFLSITIFSTILWGGIYKVLGESDGETVSYEKYVSLAFFVEPLDLKKLHKDTIRDWDQTVENLLSSATVCNMKEKHQNYNKDLQNLGIDELFSEDLSYRPVASKDRFTKASENQRTKGYITRCTSRGRDIKTTANSPCSPCRFAETLHNLLGAYELYTYTKINNIALSESEEIRETGNLFCPEYNNFYNPEEPNLNCDLLVQRNWDSFLADFKDKLREDYALRERTIRELILRFLEFDNYYTTYLQQEVINRAQKDLHNKSSVIYKAVKNISKEDKLTNTATDPNLE